MPRNLKVVLECFSINPILEEQESKHFTWLGTQNPPILELRHNIEYIIMNIRKIKLPLDATLEKHQLQFPFTQDEFNTFASKLAGDLHMEDYILAPLLVSSKEIKIGIIILKACIRNGDILESYNYLSRIRTSSPTRDVSKVVECKCDLMRGILAMDGKNRLSEKMKLYIMNCRGYIPQVIIRQLPNRIKAMNFFKKQVELA